MTNFISRLFGKSERANEPSCQHPLPDFSQYEPEYIAYCIEQEQTVSHLEARLHESDDPKEIATLTLKTVCDFYGADWAGILDVDLDLDIWTPLWWYNTHSRDHTIELFEGNDIAKSVPNWAKALKYGTPIIIPDRAGKKVNFQMGAFKSYRTSFGRSPSKNQPVFTSDELRKIREKQEVL